ncbi:hypothetical protein GCM10022393_36100 [Aquimarina addita]|uniref:DUF3592 domain-containing protein n=1 Tax=Aquimarina addita TaxID=870485 RepID=A0ABP6UQY4_9FLAO
MKGYSKLNVFTKVGFTFALILLLPNLTIIIGSVFTKDLDIKPEFFLGLIPGIIYIFYVLLFVRNYYKRKVAKRIKSLKEFKLTIDEMISDTVKFALFNTLGGAGTKITEYYFIFYNKEYDKFIRVSSVNMVPDYMDVRLKSWEHLPITIFIDPKELNNPKKGRSKKKVDKHTLRTFRFYKDNYNLDTIYEYSISEDIARRNYLSGIFILLFFMIICMYVLINFF